jgi:hypothetical protein
MEVGRAGAAARRTRKRVPEHSTTSACSHRVLRARGRLLANEMAPRVHNSGHWTIEGPITSSSRIICARSRPAARQHGGARPQRHAELIGAMPAARSGCSARPVTALHDYGKSPRPAARWDMRPCVRTILQIWLQRSIVWVRRWTGMRR